MAAGDVHTILRPKIRVAPVGSVLPTIGNTATDPIVYNSSWELVKRTGNGAQITTNSPMQDITSDEIGVIGVVSAGTENVTIAWQTRTPQMKLIQYLAHMSKTSVTSSVAAGSEHPQYDVYKQDVGSQPFMVAVEGTYGTGGLTEFGGKVLALGYYVLQTENTQLVARTTGADAIVQPAATVRCLPTVLTTTQVPATGAGVLSAAALDEKFNLIVIPKTA